MLARTPQGPAFTVVLVCHVAAVLVGMVTLGASALSSARLVAARKGELPASVRAYFSPGSSWTGRVLWLVPAFGVALLAMSGGAYRVGQGWVVAGFGLWGAAMALCEGVLWPAERRIRRSLGAREDSGPVPVVAVRDSRVVLASAAAVFVLLVAGIAVMVAKP